MPDCITKLADALDFLDVENQLFTGGNGACCHTARLLERH
jgi:hypothetical protein